MPAYDSIGFDDNDHLFPAGPGPPQQGPEEPIRNGKAGPGTLSFEDGNLLTKSQDLDRQAPAITEEDAEGSEKCDEEHGSLL